MTDDKLYTSLSANTIMAQLTNRSQRTRLITTSTDKHYSLDSEDDFRSGCRNVSHQQQFFSELYSPGRSHNTNYPLICCECRIICKAQNIDNESRFHCSKQSIICFQKKILQRVSPEKKKKIVHKQ